MTINNKKDEDKYYKTADLALVIALSLHFPIDSLERTSSKRVYFYFQKTSELEKVLDSYWNTELKVEPQRYFGQLKVIKTRIYSGR